MLQILIFSFHDSSEPRKLDISAVKSLFQKEKVENCEAIRRSR